MGQSIRRVFPSIAELLQVKLQSFIVLAGFFAILQTFFFEKSGAEKKGLLKNIY